MNPLIAFMAKLSPELLEECVDVFGTPGAPTEDNYVDDEKGLRKLVDSNAIAITAVRAAQAAMEKPKVGRRLGAKTRVRKAKDVEAESK